MMNVNGDKKRVKGFTIVEMVVVIAIIGILLGVLAPSMMAYYRASRLRTANANAKMVYNGVQTEIMKYMSKDRVSTDKSGLNGTVWIGYDPSNGKSFSEDPNMPASLTATSDGTTITATTCNDIIDEVNRSVSGARDVCWAVYVDNYIVKGCVSADNGNTNYVGFYSANKQEADDLASAKYATKYLTILNDVKKNYSPNNGTAYKP